MWQRLFKRVASTILVVLVFGFTALIWSLPDVAALARTPPSETAFMRIRARQSSSDRDPAPLPWTALESVSPAALCAIVKAEDAEFFAHAGVDWGRTWTALRSALSGARPTGASTITQQVARNLYLSPERTASRKLREALIAAKLERHLSKAQILELYINIAEWGDGVWGLPHASEHYLQKRPAELDVFEGAFLASMLAAPRRPLTGSNMSRAHRVQGRVLAQLYLSGVVDERSVRSAFGSWRVLARARLRGVPLNSALSLARGAPALRVPLPELRDTTSLLAAQAIATGCGRTRELHNSAGEHTQTEIYAGPVAPNDWPRNRS